MTPEAQRIALADSLPEMFRVMSESKDLCWKPNGSEYEQDVDPLTDLNAIHAAAKATCEKRGWTYSVRFGVENYTIRICDSRQLGTHAIATAVNPDQCAALCEALLRALNLWTE